MTDRDFLGQPSQSVEGEQRQSSETTHPKGDHSGHSDTARLVETEQPCFPTVGLHASQKRKCRVAPHDGCSHCKVRSIAEVTERLRKGMVVDEVAAELGQTVQHVFDVRRRARKAGCLPQPTTAEAEADRRALARVRHGERTCSECKRTFVPKLQTPNQETCGAGCTDERKKRIKREVGRSAKGGDVRAYEVCADASPEKLEEQVKVIREMEKKLARQVEETGAALEANRPKSYATWGACLEVAL